MQLIQAQGIFQMKRWKDGGEGVGKRVYRVIIDVGLHLEINQQLLTKANPEPSLGNTYVTGEVPHTLIPTALA